MSRTYGVTASNTGLHLPLGKTPVHLAGSKQLVRASKAPRQKEKKTKQVLAAAALQGTPVTSTTALAKPRVKQE